MKISAKTLIRLGACSEQVDKFRSIFGDETTTITEALCVKHAQDFSWAWAVNRLLPASAEAAYDAARASAEAAYDAARDSAWAAYGAALASAEASAEAAYDAARASAFGKLAEQE